MEEMMMGDVVSSIETVESEQSDANEEEEPPMASGSPLPMSQEDKEERHKKWLQWKKMTRETIAPVKWDVDRIFKESAKERRDVTAAVMSVIAAHDVRRETKVRRYKAALNHCINAKPTLMKWVGKRFPIKPHLRRLVSLSTRSTTEYDYRILQASRFFFLRVRTLNDMLIEIEERLRKKKNGRRSAKLLDTEDAAEESGEMSDVCESSQEDDEEEEPEEKEKADFEPEPERIRWTGAVVDATRPREERFTAFVNQLFYHVEDACERECLDWMAKIMADSSEYANVPNVIQRAKILEYFKIALPSLHCSDFWPTAVQLSDVVVQPRVIKININTDFLGELIEEPEEDHEMLRLHAKLMERRATKAKEEAEANKAENEEKEREAKKAEEEKKEKEKAETEKEKEEKEKKKKEKVEKEKEKAVKKMKKGRKSVQFDAQSMEGSDNVPTQDQRQAQTNFEVELEIDEDIASVGPSSEEIDEDIASVGPSSEEIDEDVRRWIASVGPSSAYDSSAFGSESTVMSTPLVLQRTTGVLRVKREAGEEERGERRVKEEPLDEEENRSLMARSTSSELSERLTKERSIKKEVEEEEEAPAHQWKEVKEEPIDSDEMTEPAYEDEEERMGWTPSRPLVVKGLPKALVPLQVKINKKVTVKRAKKAKK